MNNTWAFSYLLNSLWQIPLLFAIGWLIARAASRVSATAEHRAWVSVQLLQVFLPAISAFPLRWAVWHVYPKSPANSSVIFQFGPGIQMVPSGLPGWTIGLVLAVYMAITAWLAAQFLWRCRRVAVLRRSSVEAALTLEQSRIWTNCLSRFGVRKVTLRTSNRASSPLTFGIIRPIILLPNGMLPRLAPEEFHAVLSHEVAHIARRDFLYHLLCEALALPIGYHPLHWATRERVTETREMVCDAMAASSAGPKVYGRSLLRLASLLVNGRPARFPHAIGVFDAHMLERRIMRLKSGSVTLCGPRRFAVVSGCSALLILTAVSLTTLGVHAGSVQPDPAQASHSPGPQSVPPGKMTGNLLTKVSPAYPVEAKRAGIQGTVVLRASINREGHVTSVSAISGPKELRQSAIDAVRQWTFKPYLKNGQPIDVETKIQVGYSLK